MQGKRRRLSELEMSAFGRGMVRTVLLSGLSAVAIACAASFAFANPQPPLEPPAPGLSGEMRILAPLAPETTRGSSGRVSSPLVGEDQGGGSRYPTQQESADACDHGLRGLPPPLAPPRGDGCASDVDSAEKRGAFSPVAPLKFGDLDDATPLLIVFTVGHTARDPALKMSGLSRPELDLESGAALQEAPALPVVYDPTAGPPLSPMQSALKAALERLVTRADHRNPLGSGDWRAVREAIAAFYTTRDYASVWVDEDGLTKVGRAALSQLRRAHDDGLDLSAFALPRDFAPGLDPDARAEVETTIASAIVTYAEQATGSRVLPSHVSPLIFATPSVVDPGIALAETAAAVDPAKRLADFNPPQKGYRDLRDQLRRLESPGVAERGFHILSADLDPDPPDLQEEAASQRTKRALNAHIHTASTSAGLAYGLSARQRAAILANMEMWRWEPRDMGDRRIEVNVADFSLAVLEGGRVIHEARVVVGKPETPTPIFSDIMRYVLINPSWQVPDSIIKKEMMSRLGSLSRRGYEVKSVGGRVTVRQLPGQSNALGRFAFMFPNDHAIYLHDTPARELFDDESRAFSHGCIRVDDAQSLAEVVLGGPNGWTDERIAAAIGGPERTVFLPRPLPIHIEYFTDFVDEFGELKERPDVYGLIRKVELILARASQD
jgi:murein L,D-transpeptidase YcbB/YkuD